jgi:proline iminopeptidase
VASLVLSSPLVSTSGWMDDASALLATLPDEVRTTIEAHERRGAFDDPAYARATEVFYRRYLCRLDPWPAELARTMRELGEGPYHAMWGPSEFTQTGSLGGADLRPSLSRLRRPSLWICGDQDEVVPDRLAGFAAHASGRVEVFEGGSHCLHLEQTDRYLRVVGEFLDQVDRG